MQCAVYEGIGGEKIQVMLRSTDLRENICFTTLCRIFTDLPEILVLHLYPSAVPVSTPGEISDVSLCTLNLLSGTQECHKVVGVDSLTMWFWKTFYSGPPN